ncbi:chemotaxis protein CheW [Thauera aromatica]|uniref:chemotaxis protein CheW n=1 Tax=Thauera aromatica TaxID=59405 RepID=UPI001FFC909B|nr:chemotaxis protein CheW [Thauera aromatica]MCK2086746.1 chemotaxis protein CheW [Thauera aromatica]MCK2128071.1 chemotaxis protein CheW [Thauera aromatica]
MSETNLTVAGAPTGSSGGQYLVFMLNGETFAIDILQIREIIEYGSLTEVPMTPPTVRGVINLRGAVVPVIDLSARFGRARSTVGRRSCIVIVEVESDGGAQRQTLGVLVDGVSEVLEIGGSEIEPAPSFGARIRTDFIAGMARVGGRFIVVLDVGRVFSVDEIATFATLAEGGHAMH